jgi:uncharacterized membrane-anchored protein
MNLGYAIGTAIFFTFFMVAVSAQILTKSYHRFLYWAVIVATTTIGTTMADFADRSLGIGYIGSSLILFVFLLSVLLLWRFTLGSVSVNNITSYRAEIFYWATILFSNTLGTALGDLLAVITALYFFTKLSRTFLFWAAFILTRPLGAILGDFLTKPHEHGGLDLSRISSSATLAALMIFCIIQTSKKAGNHTKAIMQR